jgi:tRNA dimethylallyltransferase
MDIATGKDIDNGIWKKDHWEIEGIPVWMLDVVRPDQEFSAANYCEMAQEIIKQIIKNNKLPISVGGTGFYIKGLIDGIGTFGVPPDWDLRNKLELKNAEELFVLLSKLDAQKAASVNVSDRKNPRRLVRAIEVSSSKENISIKKFSEIKFQNILMIGLKAPYEELYRRIDQRIDQQVEMGAEKEIKQLLNQGLGWDLPSMTAMGYRIWQDYFEGKINKTEVISLWKFSEHNYARRQMTWFRKDKRVNWFDITSQNWEREVEDKVNQWYNAVKI